MRVRTKLLLLVVAVALVPLSISGVLAMQVHQRAYDTQLAQLHQSRAQTGAARVEASLARTLESMQLLVSRTIHWDKLAPAERQAALGLVYRVHDDLAMVTLLDATGAGVGEAVFRGDPGGELREHPIASMEALSSFAHQIPFAGAQQRGRAVGDPFFVPGASMPMVAVAFAIVGPRDERWVVAGGLACRAICATLGESSEEASGGIVSLLVDRQDQILCGARAGQKLDVNAAMFTAAAGLPGGWRVVTQQLRATAFAASLALRRQNVILIAVSLVTALLAGLLLARRIDRPLDRLTRGARALQGGQFDHRVRLESADELGELASAFDQMAAEIEQRQAAINAFNAELQARVEERTRQLEETQALLLQSQKIAAVSSLGAGIAHEINNPLTSVLGFAQILKRRATKDKRERDGEALGMIEAEAQRIRRIVQTLLSFTQDFGGESFTECDVNQVIESALQHTSAGDVKIVRELAGELPRTLGNPAQLEEAFRQLLKNAVTAMQGKGTLTVRSAIAGGVLQFEVVDTGRGIAAEHLQKIFDPFFTTKDEWSGEGLGLTIVHRIVEQHHGRIRAQSQPGAGSTFTMALPAADRRAHLA